MIEVDSRYKIDDSFHREGVEAEGIQWDVWLDPESWSDKESAYYWRELENRRAINDIQIRERLSQLLNVPATWQCLMPRLESVLHYPYPVDMVLYCPECFEQHIDRPQPEKGWDNPPHRSHECQICEHVWRPADIPTNGVESIKTKGRRDGFIRTGRP